MFTVDTRTIANGGAATERINVASAVAGSFTLPAAFTGTSITVQFTNNSDGTGWSNADSAFSVSANNTYSIPSAAFNASFIRLVSNATEGADRNIAVGLRK